jgi:hypothetical protein
MSRKLFLLPIIKNLSNTLILSPNIRQRCKITPDKAITVL